MEGREGGGNRGRKGGGDREGGREREETRGYNVKDNGIILCIMCTNVLYFLFYDRHLPLIQM